MSFFKQTLLARLNQNKDKYPLLKLNELLDWTAIADILRKAKKDARQDRRGYQGYDPLKMFKAILLGQWHSLSDPALEHALSVRADFIVFCDFDDTEYPDHATLCRYRQWLIKSDLLSVLMTEINTQLEAKQLKIRHAAVAVVDASIISSAGAPLRKALEVSAKGEVSATPASKDSDAKWVKKAGKFYLGYKLHARCDSEGYLEALTLSPANAHESQHLVPLLDGLSPQTQLQADKGYASKANREYLQVRQLKDGIMHKARRGKPLTDKEKAHNRHIKQTRWVIEQSFGTLKRRFCFSRASYFGLEKVRGQSLLKAMCLNLLKAMNKVSYA